MCVSVRLILSGEELASVIVPDSTGVFRFDVEYRLSEDMVGIVYIETLFQVVLVTFISPYRQQKHINNTDKNRQKNEREWMLYTDKENIQSHNAKHPQHNLRSFCAVSANKYQGF